MKLYLGILVLISIAISASYAKLPPPFKEECIEVKFPPDSKRSVPSYTVDLDLPPKQRWAKIVKEKTPELKQLFQVVKNLTSPFFNGSLIKEVDLLFPFLARTLPYPFNEEITGMAEATGIPIGEVTLLNIFYEIFTVCTSILVKDSKGDLYHARNLDFGLFLGWDTKKHTWKVPEALRSLIANIDFKRNGKVVFKSASFIGYVGILTAIKPKIFTYTMNERFVVNGGFVGILGWLAGDRSAKWVGMFGREVMENSTSFLDAKNKLEKTKLIAPAYVILGGNKSDEAVILTRGRNDVDILRMANWTRNWYLLQTNYDHWKKPLFIDDRRTPGIKCMDQQGQNKSSTMSGLFNVLSSRPMLNKLTVYTALMRVKDGYLQTYLQDCADKSCWAF